MNKLELLDVLKTTDEISLLEILEITSEDLLDRFQDRIEDKLPQLYAKANENS